MESNTATYAISCWQKNGIKMLGKGGFSAAVGAQHRHKASCFHLQAQIFKYGHTRRSIQPGIGKAEMLRRNDIFQAYSSESGVQRPAAPQGSTRPLAFTGSPSSPAFVLPP